MAPAETPIVGAASKTTANVQAPNRVRSDSHRLNCIRQPDQGSLHDVMIRHAGIPLFLRPRRWTDIHSRLLEAHFKSLPPCVAPVPSSKPGSPPSKGHTSPSPTISALSDALTEILGPGHSARPTAVKTVLQILWPNCFSESRPAQLHLHFGEHVYRDAVRVPQMWNFPKQQALSLSASFQPKSKEIVTCSALGDLVAGSHDPTGLPMLCYIDRSRRRIASGHPEVRNEPVLELERLKRKKRPSNPEHDAYFVGVFLTMAQRHFMSVSPQELPAGVPASRRSPHFHDVKLRILTHSSGTAEFIVYTAYVTPHFLQRFHDPSRSPNDATSTSMGMKIDFTRVPIWPILGLRERLGKALGPDLVGIIDEGKIETWLPVETEAPNSAKGKRDRDDIGPACTPNKRVRGPDGTRRTSARSGESSRRAS